MSQTTDAAVGALAALSGCIPGGINVLEACVGVLCAALTMACLHAQNETPASCSPILVP